MQEYKLKPNLTSLKPIFCGGKKKVLLLIHQKDEDNNRHHGITAIELKNWNTMHYSRHRWRMSCMKYLLPRKVAVEQVKEAVKFFIWFCDVDASECTPIWQHGSNARTRDGIHGRINVNKHCFVMYSLNFCLMAWNIFLALWFCQHSSIGKSTSKAALLKSSVE